MQTDPDIAYSVRGAAAVLSFDRPERMNAARMKTHADFVAALDRAEQDDAVRAIVVTGNGKAFCAGTDISEGFRLPEGGNPSTGEGVPADIGGTTVLRLFRSRKPVIAAVNGAAVGFGASLSIACDMRIASPAARWGFVFARRGIAPESCISWFLPRAVGMATALDWMMTGRMVSAEEAAEAGMLKAVVAPDALLDTALAIVEDIAANTAAVSVAMNRQLLWRMAGAAHPSQAHALESRALAARLSHSDSGEGVAAFSEKRPPRFEAGLEGASVMDGWWPESGR